MNSIMVLLRKAITKIKEQRTIREFEIVKVSEELNKEVPDVLEVWVSEVTANDLIQVRVFCDDQDPTFNRVRAFSTGDLLGVGCDLYRFMAEAMRDLGLSIDVLSTDGFGWSPTTMERLDARIKEFQFLKNFGAAE